MEKFASERKIKCFFLSLSNNCTNTITMFGFVSKINSNKVVFLPTQNSNYITRQLIFLFVLTLYLKTVNILKRLSGLTII